MNLFKLFFEKPKTYEMPKLLSKIPMPIVQPYKYCSEELARKLLNCDLGECSIETICKLHEKIIEEFAELNKIINQGGES